MADNKLDIPASPVVEEIDDPMVVLETLKCAILRQDVDRPQVTQALRQVLHNYEMQNRVFMIAAANAELPRILRLMTFLNSCEKEMMSDTRIEGASTRELTRLYALAQSNLISSLDSVKRVADMRLEMMRAGGKAEQLFDAESAELSTLSGMPGLDSQSRDRVRKLVGGLLESINKDTSVSESQEDDTDDSGMSGKNEDLDTADDDTESYTED